MKNNQSGLSSILFAMIFTIILSLLAVGFAALVRNDQRQTLDQSLGYQAQYAAETAVNQVKSKIDDGTITSASPDCGSTSPYEIITGSGVKVTCVTWDNKAKSLIYEQVGTEPVAIPIEVQGVFNKLVITWTADNKTVYGNASEIPNDLYQTHFPIIKATYLTEVATSTVQHYYVPTSGGGTINFNPPADDGDVGAASCSAAECKMTINFTLVDINNGYLSLAALGQIASRITIEAYNGVNAQNMLNAQYTIDATAIAQDVTKRVQARVPYGKQTWRPGFAASADSMCKDIRIDGSNNNQSVSGAAVCP